MFLTACALTGLAVAFVAVLQIRVWVGMRTAQRGTRFLVWVNEAEAARLRATRRASERTAA